MVTGVCRDVGSRPPWRCPRLSCLLVVVAVLTGLPSTRGDCAAVHPKCYCGNFNYGGDRDYGYSIVCKDMGDITQVPQFKASSTVYGALMFNGTRLLTVQRGAFNGLKVKRYFLTQST